MRKVKKHELRLRRNQQLEIELGAKFLACLWTYDNDGNVVLNIFYEYEVDRPKVARNYVLLQCNTEIPEGYHHVYSLNVSNIEWHLYTDV